ncbi:MAG: threonine synthase [Rhodospirillaceae bacterium]|nr:threonine synthase [Rhodospirillaceae bacterium]
MRYLSTRGAAPALAFDDVLLTGLARDGGLYLPESWPQLDLSELAGLDYPTLAARVMRPFLGGRIGETEFARLVGAAYAGFGHRAVAPLRQIDSRVWLMELFHGPTLAFKDVALQLLGRLYDHVLAQRGQRVTIVGATSGDTGSAAIEACRDRARVDIFILHPEGRTSEVQRRQMTTVQSANVRNIAIRGSFDDCQDLVKAMFADAGFRDEMRLAAVNSINWGRIMAQIVYYFAAALALGAPRRRIAFAVPTGNFGNVYAGYAARAMGLPIDKLIVGSNRNDILTRFITDGAMEIGEVQPTLSPSMDIQVSSNAERLLFDLYGRDGGRLTQAMKNLRDSGRLALDAAQHKTLTGLFAGYRFNDQETLATMGALYRETGQQIDPHSAIGVAAARAEQLDPDVAVVALATAHPAKFPDAVERATGRRPALPPALADLYERPENFQVLPNDLTAVEGHIRAEVGRGKAA